MDSVDSLPALATGSIEMVFGEQRT